MILSDQHFSTESATSCVPLRVYCVANPTRLCQQICVANIRIAVLNDAAAQYNHTSVLGYRSKQDGISHIDCVDTYAAPGHLHFTDSMLYISVPHMNRNCTKSRRHTPMVPVIWLRKDRAAMAEAVRIGGML